MEWLARDPERRLHPERVLPGVRAIVCVGLNYYQTAPLRRGRIATYALGEDYHNVMEERLEEVACGLRARGGEARVYVDTGPVLEKPRAQEAGLGWQAKSTMLLHRRFGTWLFLGEVLTTLPLAFDRPETTHCGTCTKCIEVCPTQAITAPYQLDARRCIAYLTIELKGSIPEAFRPLIGDHVYGCDDCLDVCPWNRWAQTTREARFQARDYGDLREWFTLTPSGFKERFAGSPILRLKRRGLLRNACVVLGNVGTSEDEPILRQALLDEEPLIREHAAWALERIAQRFKTTGETLPAGSSC
jgi:epoxyqueuosine reductase